MSLKVKRNLMLLGLLALGISGLTWAISTAYSVPADSAEIFWAGLIGLISAVLSLGSFISLCVRIWNDKE
jgi:hypothetical protein